MLPTARDMLEAAQRLKNSNMLHNTPLEHCSALSEHTGRQVYQKLELMQRTGSFKLRGAANKILKLREQNPAALQRGLVTASAGNHAQGVCYVAARLGLKATIVVAETAAPTKIAAIRRYPVELVLYGQTYDEAEAYARKLENERGLTFVSAYNDPDIIAGQGTVAVEALAALPQADLLLVPVGGGGLISGIALWAKAVNPAIKIIGVQSEASPAMHAALAAGRLVPALDLPSLADGLTGGIEADSITFDIVRQRVDDLILVTEADIAAAMRFLVAEQHLIVEGSGAVGTAALLSGRVPPATVTLDFITGRNLTAATLQKVLLSVELGETIA